MILYERKEQCCGCMACEKNCPAKAIKIQKDEEGFWYPIIDSELCINCKLCKKICMFQHEAPKHNKVNFVYAVKNKNESIRNKSTSGGFNMGLAMYIIKNNGVVYGAAINNNLEVKHIRITDIDNLKKIYGSKYVQSNIEDVFGLISQDLKENKEVLFTGTPCQVDAIKSFLNNKGITLDKLITCDIICHGVPSNKIFMEHIKFLERMYDKKIVSYQFRTKDYGWIGHNEKAIFEDGTSTSDFKNRYMNIYKELYGSLNIIRPSCYECPYASNNRVGDITMGDFWGIEKINKDFFDNNGISFIKINTKKGENVFNQIKQNFDYINNEIENCKNPQLKGPTLKPKNREIFWREYHSKGYKYVKKKYTTYGIFKRVKVKTYRLLKKIHAIKGE